MELVLFMELITECKMIFYSYFDILLIGGPEICHGNLSSNYNFDDNSLPRIGIVSCGVPQPVVQAEFFGQKLNVLKTTINSYTHNYTVQLPQLTQTVCGKELIVVATGYNGTLTSKIKIYVNNCKYDYYVDLVFKALINKNTVC